jgi:hypothetical protein
LIYGEHSEPARQIYGEKLPQRILRNARTFVNVVPGEISFIVSAKTSTSNQFKILKKFRNDCVSLWNSVKISKFLIKQVKIEPIMPFKIFIFFEKKRLNFFFFFKFGNH